MTLPGPSRRIRVEPLRVPKPDRAPAPRREPAREPAKPRRREREKVPA